MRISLQSSIPLAALFCLTAVEAAEHHVGVQNFGFSPAQLTIQAGDTVIWENDGQGVHNVIADDGAFSSGAPVGGAWTFSHVFENEGEFPYFCSLHGAAGGVGMSGRVIVEAGEPAPVFTLNEGINGVWHNPGTDGQGWLFDISPSINLFFGAWFTWTDEVGGYDWFTVQGEFEGNTATVPLIRTRGGRFNASDPVTRELAGEATFVFENCERAEVSIQLVGSENTIVIPLFRVTPVPSSCTQPQPSAATEH